MVETQAVVGKSCGHITRSIRQIHSKINYERLYRWLEHGFHESLKHLDLQIKELEKATSDLLYISQWVRMKNNAVWYYNQLQSLFPNPETFPLQIDHERDYTSDSLLDQMNFSNYNGEQLLEGEFDILFINKENIPFLKNGYLFIAGEKSKSSKISYINLRNKRFFGNFNPTNYNPYIYHMPIHRLGEKNTEPATVFEAIALWIKHDLEPDDLLENELAILSALKTIFNKQSKGGPEYFNFSKNEIKLNIGAILADFSRGNLSLIIDGNDWDREKIASRLLAGENLPYLKLDDFVIQELLNCDKIRADIDSYDKKILSDPNRGHWDLWDDLPESDSVTIKLNNAIIARDPAADVESDGVVGIDFGTKSTIVVQLDKSEKIIPMRVGMGEYSKKPEARHYENPTILEFIDGKSFIEKYIEKLSRPDTLWEELTVSHTALNSLLHSTSEKYYSFLCELKQWAGNKDRQIRLRDKNHNEYILKSYLDGNNDFDPIEFYAYYIGLYINNMQQRRIFLDYILSFPVTFEMAVRDRIISSFRNGLKKSLPGALLKNDLKMKRFSVIAGASEPAAYAICALEAFGFKPENDEKFLYGVFDFGGGTTDFDFGIWRAPNNEKEQRRYDYVIEHFAAGGDRYLGGENLLELLSFDIFSDNREELLDRNIPFTIHPERTRFPGYEKLIRDSQEAKVNTRQMAEKLRPLWECHDGYEKLFEGGIIKVDLHDSDGRMLPNFELKIDMEALNKTICERIERGVENFFEKMKQAFACDELKETNEIQIFLAGNACKAAIVKELFDKHIKKQTEKCNEEFNDGADEKTEHFHLFHPLGTREAMEIQKAKGMDIDDSIDAPTGKSGVAFGLIKSRRGGRIKVIDNNIKDGQIAFRYYAGCNCKNKLRPILDPVSEYNEWKEFIGAEEEIFELYYTTDPEAGNYNMSIKSSGIKRVRGHIEAHPEANIYIRAAGPSTIEYAVALSSEELKTSRDITSITLE